EVSCMPALIVRRRKVRVSDARQRPDSHRPGQKNSDPKAAIFFSTASTDHGLCGRSLPFVAARTPRIIATMATSGMMKPPRRSLASPETWAPLRAATESGAAEVCAKTGVLPMETARAAATDAFFKLILNSLLSCSILALPQRYWIDKPKSVTVPRRSNGVAGLHSPSLTQGKRTAFQAVG